MKPHMGPRSDLCPRTSDSSEGHHASYLIVYWEVKSKLTDGGGDTRMSAELGSLLSAIHSDTLVLGDKRVLLRGSDAMLLPDTWASSTWAYNTWASSTHLSHFCPGCQESHTEFNTLWTMIYPAFLINYAFISFICFTSLTFSLSSNCSVGHRFTRDYELLWAMKTSKYLQAVYLLLRHNIGTDTKYPQMHNITLLWS